MGAIGHGAERQTDTQFCSHPFRIGDTTEVQAGTYYV